MAGPSKIEWTERTWNPIVGCSILTPGCTNCYAMKMAARIQKMNRTGGSNSNYVNHYDGTTKVVNGHAVWTGKLAIARDGLFLAPLHRKQPTTYFVNSMGDLFHESAPDEWIDRVFAVMALCRQHTFQVLTKRAERMLEYMTRGGPTLQTIAQTAPPSRDVLTANTDWPLPNVWLGVSTERQQEADERIPLLLQTPAAVRFISAEPLLGPIDLTAIEAPDKVEGERWTFSALQNGDYYEQWSETMLGEPRRSGSDGPYREHALDWVIVGGESGSNARPMHPDWARALRDQCDAAGVPMFFKQWGNWTPGENVERQRGIVDTAHWFDNRWCLETENLANCEGHVDDQPDVYCVGKKEAGRKLDGREHNDMPKVSA